MFATRSPFRLFVRKPTRRERLAVTAKRFVIATAFVGGAAYVTAPYITIWRLATALQQGDTTALQATVDWDDVREGIKEDIADGITASEAPIRAQSDDLPGFGDSFIKNIADDQVDKEIAPDRMSTAFRQMEQGGSGSFGSFLYRDVHYAFFDGVGHFLVSFSLPGQESTEPVQVELSLQDYGWKVVRVRVPGTLAGLDAHPKRT